MNGNSQSAKDNARTFMEAHVRYYIDGDAVIATETLRATLERFFELMSSQSNGPAERPAPMKLWLWKNFVDGDPQYWAFESPFPRFENGDPITLGSPAGYAIVKPCMDGRDGRTDESVVEEIKRALKRSNATPEGGKHG